MAKMGEPEVARPSRPELRCWRCGKLVQSQLLKDAMCEDEGMGDSRKWHGGLGPLWVTWQALVEHGLLSDFGQTIEDYPPAWHRSYLRSK